MNRATRQKLFPWYYSMSRRTRQRLTGVFVISLAIHCVFLAGMGGVVVFRYFKRPPAHFKSPPPPAERIEPRKLEYKVRVEEQQKKSGRPVVTPRLTAQSVGAISLPEVKTELKPTPNKALSSLTSFGGSGIGEGLGGGTGSGGLGLGVSQVNFFGITDRGERIAFLVDVSLSMLEDEKGGIPGYEAVKTELAKMVNKLSDGTFFNVIMFGNDVDIFRPKMILASPDIKEELGKWLKPYNMDWKNGRLGNLYNNWRPFTQHQGDYYAGGIMAAGGSTRLDLALAAAFEQGADTIFILTDGVPVVGKLLQGKEKEDYDKQVEIWRKTHREHEPTQAEKKQQERAKEAWLKQIEKENADRAKRGLPPKITEAGRSWGGGPGPPGMGSWTTAEILDHLKKLQKDVYESQKRKPPRIHCVGYQTDAGPEQFLKELAYDNHGRFRRMKALVKPIVLK